MRFAGTLRALTLLCCTSWLLACSADPAASNTTRRSGMPSAGATGGSGAHANGAAGAAIDGASTGSGAAGNASAPNTAGGGAPDGGAPSSSGSNGDGFTTAMTPPDPNVTFEWTATLPGGGDCEPGRYTGTFTCNYVLTGGDPTMPLVVVTGPIVMTLERSQDGEFLEISDGKLEGIAMLIIGFRAQLTGRLDCATGKLEATATNGIYGFGDPAVFPAGMFMGTLGGMLDTTTAQLAGSWDLAVAGGGGSCIGPWQASWTP